MTLSRVKMEVLLSASRVIGGGTLEYTLAEAFVATSAMVLSSSHSWLAGSSGATWLMPAALFLVPESLAAQADFDGLPGDGFLDA